MVSFIDIRPLKRVIGAFAADRRGNIAITFALALLPIIGFIGAVADFSRANHARTKMQAALDSAALMLSKDADTLIGVQLANKAQGYFDANYNSANITPVTVTAKYNAGLGNGATVTHEGNGNVPTSFLKVVGFSTVPIATTATATWGSTRLRVALALDNTGSMANSGKIDALKTAAKNLVDQLSTAGKNPGDVYVSIVPFALTVNVGTSYVDASWLRWDQWDDSTNFYTSKSWYCSDKYSFTRAVCVGHGNTWSSNAPNKHDAWKGCVIDRDQSYDVTNAAVSVGVNGTLYPADQDPECPSALVMPLTYDWTAVKARIDQMTPVGATNQPIGFAWAWNTLTVGGPLTVPAEDQTQQYKKIIVMFSDGLNTYDRWYGNGVNHSNEVDARQTVQCDKIKAAGITIYSVQLNTGGDPLSTQLKNCASGADKFFLLTSANQMVSTFQQIGTAISQLRLSK